MPTQTKPKPSDVRRPLRLTSPHAKGPDVRALQLALNKRRRARGLKSIPADGEYGPQTAAAVADMARRLGALESTIAKGGTEGIQDMIRDPDSRTAAQLKRAESRERAREKAAKANGTGGDAAVKWARSKIGVAERPQGSNRGPQIDQWCREAGFLAGPWCGAFAKASAKAGGAIVTPEARYVPWLERHARAHTGGYDGWQSSNDVAAMARFAEPGDHVCFDFGGAGDAGVNDHVGVLVRIYKDSGGRWRVVTIDGNTSGSNPADGGRVEEVDRPIKYVAGIAKVRWPA